MQSASLRERVEALSSWQRQLLAMRLRRRVAPLIWEGAATHSARLIACVVPKPAALVDQPGLFRFLENKLPEYMVPRSYLFLEEIPLTPNGKIDRQRLLLLERERTRVAGPQNEPRNPVEEILSGVWARALGQNQLDIHGNFFDLGGHSLLAAQVVVRIREVLGVDLPVRSLFEAPTVAELAEVIRSAQGRGGSTGLPAIPKVPRDEAVPLSFAQERIWFLEQLNSGAPAYNISGELELLGPLEVRFLERSFQDLIARHESLRTNVRIEKGRPWQEVRESCHLTLSVVDLEILPEDERWRAARSWAENMARQRFDLENDILIRFALLRLAPDRHLILYAAHHLIADGWSFGVMIDEVMNCYGALVAGRFPKLPPLAVQYRDVAAWQRNHLASAVFERQRRYWIQQLADAPRTLEMMTDYRRPAVQTYEGIRLAFSLDRKTTASLKALSRQEGATLFMTLLAGYYAVLNRYSGQNDIVIGTPFANREMGGLERVIGCLVNTLALRVRISSPAATFREVLQAVRAVALDAYANSDVPFEQVVAALHLNRDAGRSPLFQTMLVFQSEIVSHSAPPNLTIRPVALDDWSSVRSDLDMYLWEGGGILKGYLIFSRMLFDVSTMEGFKNRFCQWAQHAAEFADRPLRDIPLDADYIAPAFQPGRSR